MRYPPTTPDVREAEAGRQVAWLRANRDKHYLWGGDVPPDRAKYLPYMVRFRNMADPRSVDQVDPADLSKTFGPAYQLISLTVQLTDEPVTIGINKKLSWLKELPERRLVPIPTGGVVNPSIGRILSFGDFRKGELK